jgi:two-component system, chemotaxis family, CheB/CheR fusion protein
MDELLIRRTKMPVHVVTHGMEIEPNSIYLIPPKRKMIVSGGRLMLTDKDPEQGLALPIDIFFRSLAQDYGPSAIGMILSGTWSDGSRGIRDIHTAGGLVLVQSEETAKFDGMPLSAIETGIVDAVLSPTELAQTLARYAKHPVPKDVSDWHDKTQIDERAAAAAAATISGTVRRSWKSMTLRQKSLHTPLRRLSPWRASR